jgi:hypothetical protein
MRFDLSSHSLSPPPSRLVMTMQGPDPAAGVAGASAAPPKDAPPPPERPPPLLPENPPAGDPLPAGKKPPADEAAGKQPPPGPPPAPPAPAKPSAGDAPAPAQAPGMDLAALLARMKVCIILCFFLLYHSCCKSVIIAMTVTLRCWRGCRSWMPGPARPCKSFSLYYIILCHVM